MGKPPKIEMPTAVKLTPNLPPETTLLKFLKQKAYLWSGWCKLGLFHDDLLYEYPDVKEAIRRLPEPLVIARDQRLLRAIQLDIEKKILPKEHWVTWEEDQANRYLQPYLEQVRKERAEQFSWNADY